MTETGVFAGNLIGIILIVAMRIVLLFTNATLGISRTELVVGSGYYNLLI